MNRDNNDHDDLLYDDDDDEEALNVKPPAIVTTNNISNTTNSNDSEWVPFESIGNVFDTSPDKMNAVFQPQQQQQQQQNVFQQQPPQEQQYQPPPPQQQEQQHQQPQQQLQQQEEQEEEEKVEGDFEPGALPMQMAAAPGDVELDTDMEQGPLMSFEDEGLVIDEEAEDEDEDALPPLTLMSTTHQQPQPQQEQEPLDLYNDDNQPPSDAFNTDDADAAAAPMTTSTTGQALGHVLKAAKAAKMAKAAERASAAAAAAVGAPAAGAQQQQQQPRLPPGLDLAEANFLNAADGAAQPLEKIVEKDEEPASPNSNDTNSKKTTKKKKEINPKFKDVQTTGKWGTISKVEIYGVAAISVIIALVVIIVLAVMLSKDSAPKEETIPPATLAPTPAMTPMPVDERISLILDAVQNNTVASVLVTNGTLPSDAAFYQGLLGSGVDCSLMPHECGMAWTLYEDTFPPSTDSLVHRFAMASLYYALGGKSWKLNTNWMSTSSNTSSYCDWHGITCNRAGTEIQAMDLSENGLVGEIPIALALLDTLSLVSLKENNLKGTVPGNVFATLSNLYALYLQSNDLTGTIPDNLRNNGALELLFLDHNNFTGPFPSVYCTAGQYGDGPVLKEFSLDCDDNPCPQNCCASTNCF